MKINTLKKVLLSVALFFCVFSAGAQNSLVIDSSNTIIPLHDSILSSMVNASCGNYQYVLDIDQNDSMDFKFTAVCYLGGMGSSYSIKLESADEAYFALDTNVTDTVGVFDSTGTAVYSPGIVEMVKIYNYHDTLDGSDCNQQSQRNIVNRNLSYYPSLCEHSSLDLWISGQHYIGFKKKINGVFYYGWICVEVLDYNQIKLKSYSWNANLSALNESYIEPYRLYPNPLNDVLMVERNKTGKAAFMIHNLQGKLVLKGELQEGNNNILLNEISSGIYFFSLQEEGKTVREKLVKK